MWSSDGRTGNLQEELTETHTQKTHFVLHAHKHTYSYNSRYTFQSARTP